jgi:uncharacterized protein (TIGR03437 family)
MRYGGWISLGAAGFALAALAYPTGAPVGHSGAPRDLGTCANLGCHFNPTVGSAMRVSIGDGIVYRPGETHQVIVEITDIHRLYGFQLTARFARDPLAMAGTFAAVEDEAVRCGSLDLALEIPRGAGQSCPANAPLEYIGHDLPVERGRFAVRWTAPASGGDVVFYAAGNAANGDTTRAGDRIHATQLRVTSPGPPAFDAAAVTLATAFPGGRAIAPQAWVEIYGERLAQSVATWDSTPIGSGGAPTELAGVRVTVGGRPAYLSYVSPGQINLQVPDGVAPGLAPVTVTTPFGQLSQAELVDQASPGIWAPPAFRVSGRQFVAAQHPDGTFVGPAGFYGARIPSRSARPNDRILLWAIGMGPVNPPQTAGRTVSQLNALGVFALRFGGRAVATEYAGLAPGYIGVYQINAVVPDLAPGEYEISGSVAGGIALPSGIFLNLR